MTAGDGLGFVAWHMVCGQHSTAECQVQAISAAPALQRRGCSGAPSAFQSTLHPPQDLQASAAVERQRLSQLDARVSAREQVRATRDAQSSTQGAAPCCGALQAQPLLKQDAALHSALVCGTEGLPSPGLQNASCASRHTRALAAHHSCTSPPSPLKPSQAIASARMELKQQQDQAGEDAHRQVQVGGTWPTGGLHAWVERHFAASSRSGRAPIKPHSSLDWGA